MTEEDLFPIEEAGGHLPNVRDVAHTKLINQNTV